jgi:hypothetical protein
MGMGRKTDREKQLENRAPVRPFLMGDKITKEPPHHSSGARDRMVTMSVQ